MEKFIIQGNTHLRGQVKVSGSKNAALPILAASLLAPKKFVISNVPRINDIYTLIKIIEKIGAKTEWTGKNTLRIDNSKIKTPYLDYKLVRNIRASILLIGPLLARFGEVKIAQPGGCFIGNRPIDVHLNALKKLGAKVIQRGHYYHIKVEKIVPTRVTLEEISVTATENVLMAASLSKEETEIRMAAIEPHVEDLIRFLSKMGVRIRGTDTHALLVSGRKQLKGAKHKVIPDQIEAGTFAVAAVVSRGDVRIKGFIPEHNDALTLKLKEAGANIDIVGKDTLHIKPQNILSAVEIKTLPYPGFPTDLQAPFAVLMTQANGVSKIYETMYEGRLNYLKELGKMGADSVTENNHQAFISGPTPLAGKKIISFDLRAGATLILAALVAEGESEIDKIELVDRGYERIEEKLNSLGAKIERKTVPDKE